MIGNVYKKHVTLEHELSNMMVGVVLCEKKCTFLMRVFEYDTSKTGIWISSFVSMRWKIYIFHATILKITRQKLWYNVVFPYVRNILVLCCYSEQITLNWSYLWSFFTFFSYVWMWIETIRFFFVKKYTSLYSYFGHE